MYFFFEFGAHPSFPTTLLQSFAPPHPTPWSPNGDSVPIGSLGSMASPLPASSPVPGTDKRTAWPGVLVVFFFFLLAVAEHGGSQSVVPSPLHPSRIKAPMAWQGPAIALRLMHLRVWLPLNACTVSLGGALTLLSHLRLPIPTAEPMQMEDPLVARHPPSSMDSRV